jgi:hypothetical protein
MNRPAIQRGSSDSFGVLTALRMQIANARVDWPWPDLASCHVTRAKSLTPVFRHRPKV